MEAMEKARAKEGLSPVRLMRMTIGIKHLSNIQRMKKYDNYARAIRKSCLLCKHTPLSSQIIGAAEEACKHESTEH